MKSQRITAILAATALTAVLTGCGDEDDQPTVAGPAAEGTATQAPADPAPTTEAPAEPSEQAPSTQAPSEAAPTTGPAEGADPSKEAPAGDLPTEPTAYGDLFVQAWVDQDQALLEQLAGSPDVLTSMEMWGGQGWQQVEVTQETHGAVIIDYTDEQNMELELWVQEGITQNGEPHGVVSASVSEGPYPIPDTVEDYAMAFVDSAGGEAADREYLERLATPEAAAEAQDWVSDYVWGPPEVTDGDQEGTARVTLTSEDGTRLVLVIDRELAESAAEDAVLTAERGGGGDELSIREYADAFVLAFGEGDAERMSQFATGEVVDELRDAGGPGWVHVHSGENGGEPREVYEDSETGRTLVLSIDGGKVASGDGPAIIDAALSPQQ